MLKKNYNLNKQIILKVEYKDKFILNLIDCSLQKNHFLKPIERISYFTRNHYNNFFSKFSSFQKLQCLITLSPKVHNKKFYYSRFFLNKQLNNLTISNTLKNVTKKFTNSK